VRDQRLTAGPGLGAEKDRQTTSNKFCFAEFWESGEDP
jgi:hypothetical protein